MSIHPLYLLALQQFNYSNYLSAIRGPIADVIQEVKPSNVQLVVQDSTDGDLEVVNEICKTLTRALPASIVSLDDAIPGELPSLRVSAATLILYVYISTYAPGARERMNIIRVVLYGKIANPKVLLVTLLNGESDHNFEPFLREMWEKRILDATILDVGTTFNGGTVVKLHRYNPFRKVYERLLYSSRALRWFPDKMKNLYGYPIKVYMYERPGHILLRKNSRLYPVEYRGPDVDAIRAMAKKMNFTIELLGDQDRQKRDIIIPMVPYFPDGEFLDNAKTLAFAFEDWCPLVPIQYKEESLGIKSLFGILFNFFLLFLYWMMSLAFRLEPRTWRLLEIYRLLMSVPSVMKPRTKVEKIVYCSCMTVSALYASTTFTRLTNDWLKVKSEVEYNSFAELNRSRLAPKIHRMLFEITFKMSEDPAFLAMKNRAITYEDSNECVEYLARYRNTTCFLDNKSALMYIYSYQKKAQPVKVSWQLCLARQPAGYFLDNRSTYIGEIDDTLLRLASAGIRTKWQHDFSGTVHPQKLHRFAKRNEFPQRELMWNLIYVIQFGYLVSFIIFIAEIIIHQSDNVLR